MNQMTIREKIIVLAVLAATVLSLTMVGFHDPDLDGGDMGLIAVMVTKDLNPDLFARDYIFADDSLYRFYTPFYRWLVAQLWQMSGRYELGLIWLTPFVLSLYLIGMFWLVRRVTHDSWLALGITIASTHYYGAMGGEIWGVGDAGRMIPRTIFTAAAPFLFGGILIWLERPRRSTAILLGLGIGLSANLHPTSGLGLAILAAGLFMLNYAFVWRRLPQLLLLVVAIAAGAVPVTMNFLANTGRTVSTQISFQAFREIVNLRNAIPFKPAELEWALAGITLQRPLLDWLAWAELGLACLALMAYLWGIWRRPSILTWLWLFGGLAAVWYGYMVALFNLSLFFILVALYIIYCFWRGKINRLDSWLAAALGLIALLSFGGAYLLTWLWETFEIWGLTSLLVEQARIARFIYLPLYLLVGRAGLYLAIELQYLWQRDPFQRSAITATIGLVLAFGRIWSKYLLDARLFAGFALAGAAAIAVGIAWLASSRASNDWASRLGQWGIALGLILVVLGPLASTVQSYMPFPPINLWRYDPFTLGSFDDESDRHLYDWIRANTERQALFYPCHLGNNGVTQFRHKTRRSITHNIKDLNLGLYDRAALPAMYERLTTLEEACEDPYMMIKIGQAIEADFIILPSRKWHDLDVFAHFVCFQNKQYKVFRLDQAGCLAETSVSK